MTSQDIHIPGSSIHQVRGAPLVPLLLAVLLNGAFLIPCRAAGNGQEPVFEGRLRFELRGPGAAPFGMASGLFTTAGIALNVGRLQSLLPPGELPSQIPVDESYHCEVKFRLKPESWNHWTLDRMDLHYRFDDFSGIKQGELELKDSMKESDEIQYVAGKWIDKPHDWTPKRKPQLELRLWKADSEAACNESPPGRIRQTLHWLLGENAEGVTCFQLTTNLVHPMRPSGTSIWGAHNMGVRTTAEQGRYRFEMLAPNVPDFSALIPSRAQAKKSMEELRDFFADLTEKATGQKVPRVPVSPEMVPDSKQEAQAVFKDLPALKKSLSELKFEPDVDMEIDRTFHGIVKDGRIGARDTYLILTGAQAFDELDLPIFRAVLEKVQEGWIPKIGIQVKVRAHLEGTETHPLLWRFTLYDETREDSVCANCSQQQQGSDLRFDPALSGSEFSPPRQLSESSWRIESKRPLEKPEVLIQSRDWGSWARLKAEVKMGDHWTPVDVKDSSLKYITIPRDGKR